MCLGCVLCFIGHSNCLLVCCCVVLVKKRIMNRQKMQPFRAPRRGGKAMITQATKESQAIDENPGKAKGGCEGECGCCARDEVGESEGACL